ncbi:putative WD repeat and HMG-box DNA-binding protein 1 [Blattamonas nauphoetae]|uniref:WD repeat and HMG-box DNA-binding protein 1 n=1 Tax=Blattamonas nauphoetae TaxID=2049346 RepID=A0ABQ9XRR0_9EUKA|nr:putative WD repeat and HMG-box DNA-binding protein 1 [Blattamonas nauphoetae]
MWSRSSSEFKPDTTIIPSHNLCPCDLAYTKDSQSNGFSLVSVGDDGKIFQYKSDNLEERIEATSIMEGLTSIVSSSIGNNFAVGAMNQSVLLFSLSTIHNPTKVQCEGFSAKHLSFSTSGSLLAMCCSDSVLRVLNTNTHLITTYKETPGTLLSTSYDPKGDYITTFTDENKCYVWNVSSQEIEHTIDVSSDVAVSSRRPTVKQRFSADGTLLAIPTPTTVKFFDRRTWKESIELDEDLVMNNPSVVTWLPSDVHVAVARDHAVTLWDIRNPKQLVENTNALKLYDLGSVLNMVYIPETNGLGLSGDRGNIALVSNLGAKKEFSTKIKRGQRNAETERVSDTVTVFGEMSPRSKLRQYEDEEGPRSSDLAFLVGLIDSEGDDESLSDGNGNDEDEEEKWVNEEPKKTKRGKKTEDESKPKKKKRRNPLDDSESDDNLLDNLATLGGDSVDEEDDLQPSDIRAPQPTSTIVQASHPLQDPFQPGSTEPTKIHKKFFLSATPIGYVTSEKSEIDSSVEIIFTDSSIQTKRILDHYNFSIAAMGAAGTIFYASLVITEAHSRTQRRSGVLHFKSFQQWSGGADWTIDCPDEVISLACGVNYVASLGSNGTIRMFSPSGLQRMIDSCPGVPVCLGSGEDRFAVCYNAGPSMFANEQVTPTLGYKVCSPNDARVSSSGLLPITPGTTLTWFGFSTTGRLCSCDSKGIVRMLIESMGHVWTQVVALPMKSWPFGVNVDSVMTFESHSIVGFPLPVSSGVRQAMNAVKFLPPMLDPQSVLTKQEGEVMVSEIKLATQSSLRNETLESRLGSNQIDGRVWRVDPLFSGVHNGNGPPTSSGYVRAIAPSLKMLRNTEAEIDVNLVKIVGQALSQNKGPRAFEAATGIFNEQTLLTARSLSYKAKNNPVMEKVESMITVRFPTKTDASEAVKTLRNHPENQPGLGGYAFSPRPRPINAAISTTNVDFTLGANDTSNQVMIEEMEKLKALIKEQAEDVIKQKKMTDSLKADIAALRAQQASHIGKTKSFQQPTLMGMKKPAAVVDDGVVPEIINPFKQTPVEPKKKAEGTRGRKKKVVEEPVEIVQTVDVKEVVEREENEGGEKGEEWMEKDDEWKVDTQMTNGDGESWKDNTDGEEKKEDEKEPETQLGSSEINGQEQTQFETSEAAPDLESTSALSMFAAPKKDRRSMFSMKK